MRIRCQCEGQVSVRCQCQGQVLLVPVRLTGTNCKPTVKRSSALSGCHHLFLTTFLVTHCGTSPRELLWGFAFALSSEGRSRCHIYISRGRVALLVNLMTKHDWDQGGVRCTDLHDPSRPLLCNISLHPICIRVTTNIWASKISGVIRIKDRDGTQTIAAAALHQIYSPASRARQSQPLPLCLQRVRPASRMCVVCVQVRDATARLTRPPTSGHEISAFLDLLADVEAGREALDAEHRMVSKNPGP